MILVVGGAGYVGYHFVRQLRLAELPHVGRRERSRARKVLRQQLVRASKGMVAYAASSRWTSFATSDSEVSQLSQSRRRQ
jgi:nucleoside-diphosphate-sugar epimerase